jgi:hypothetical protein
VTTTLVAEDLGPMGFNFDVASVRVAPMPDMQMIIPDMENSRRQMENAERAFELTSGGSALLERHRVRHRGPRSR